HRDARDNPEVGKHVSAFASLRNIANSHYESFAGYYMPGLSMTVGVKTKFDGFGITNDSPK
ncbi:MAG: hypothetical protein LBC57_06280, partial [Treponema sp.]|nr:hypothetical protein [Treponema sp.]